MADQANIFGNGNQPAPAADPQQAPQQPVQQPALSPELTALVGEGRKYASVEAALASVPHAQSYIATLENEKQAMAQELAALKEQLTKATNMEDVLAKITANQTPAQDTPIPSGLDEQAVLNLLEQRDAASKAQANQVQVTNALVGKFGDEAKAIEALKGKAAELGVGFEFMQDLAAKSPKAVLSYFNVEAKPTPTVPNSTVNTAQFQAPQEPELSFSATTGTTSDLARAFHNCGIAVNGGEEINHNY